MQKLQNSTTGSCHLSKTKAKSEKLTLMQSIYSRITSLIVRANSKPNEQYKATNLDDMSPVKCTD